MSAFLSISLWVALATIIPGLVTMASLYGAFYIFLASYPGSLSMQVLDTNNWILCAAAATVMVLTQALGILLEEVLVKWRLLGPESLDIEIPKGIDPRGETSITIKPYYEYQGVYILLSELRENEDTQGHLKRVLAQFFLTNNTLISFMSGIVLMMVLVLYKPAIVTQGFIYATSLLVCLVISFNVARIRFMVMAKSLWAARRRRIKENGKNNEDI